VRSDTGIQCRDITCRTRVYRTGGAVWLAGAYLRRHGRGNADEWAPHKGRLQLAINHLDTVLDRT
jgi:hypothetical protein